MRTWCECSPPKYWSGEALNKDGLAAHYHPIVSLTDGHVMAVEALVRIISGDGDLVHPGVFIEAAERTG